MFYKVIGDILNAKTRSFRYLLPYHSVAYKGMLLH